MPFEYQYNAESNCLCVKGAGKVTLQEFLDHHRSLKINGAQPTLLILSDYRKLDPSGLTTIDIEQIRMSALKKMEGKFQKVKEAIVVSDALSYGLSRMFDSLVYTEDYEMNVFTDFREAEAWLGLEPGTVVKRP